MESETQERSADEGALPSLCLKQVYPKYAKQFNHLRLVERIAGLFIRFLGVKGNMRLGPTAFRTFIRYCFASAVATVFAFLTFAFTPLYRSCKLSNSNFTMAAVDILYIDITRRWSGADTREAGDTHTRTNKHTWETKQPPGPRSGLGTGVLSFRYGAAGVRGGLFLPGGSQVQVSGAEGAGHGAAGGVRGPAGGPGGQRGQALGELQPSAAAAQQEPGARRRQPPAVGVSHAPEEGGEPGLPPAPEA